MVDPTFGERALAEEFAAFGAVLREEFGPLIDEVLTRDNIGDVKAAYHRAIDRFYGSQAWGDLDDEEAGEDV